MGELFQINEVDRRIYDEALREFIPERIIDVHTHIWKAEHARADPEAFARVVSWPLRVASVNPVEDLMEGYRLLFPSKSVTPLIFANVFDAESMSPMNDYVSECSSRMKFPALIFAHPTWTARELESRITAGKFIGAKVYLNLSPAYIPPKEIRIFDFLPPHQLDVLNRHGWLVMLHIPRDGRLRDPVNIAQMIEIERNWPKVRVIIAHVGRAYCDEDMGDAFERLSVTRNMVFDFSANTNSRVFESALRTFGPGRCLFGSDMPITRMRMRRICEEGRYINIVPRGLYGDVSGDRNMREADAPEANTTSFFLYEEVLAIRQAVETLGLGRSDIEAIFRKNAERVLDI